MPSNFKKNLDTLPVLGIVYRNCREKAIVDYLSHQYRKKFPLQKLVGTSVLEIPGHEEVAESIKVCAATGEEEEVFFEDKGTGAWFAGTLHQINSDYVALICQDIRNIVLDNLALGRTAKLANEQNEKFIRALAHDLKEPVRAVAGFTEILMLHNDKITEEQRQDYLQRANMGALRLHDMIQELRTYALTDKINSDVEPIKVQQMLRQVMEQIEERIASEKAHVEVNIALEKELYVTSSLKRVLYNFIDNALKYKGEHDPHIIISLFTEDNHLNLCTQDNGIGFEPEEAGRIFEPFHRLEPHNETPGAGMGLAICKDIIAKMGGRIWATSEGPGAGSKFCFRVPVR